MTANMSTCLHCRYFTGSLIGGILYDRLNKVALLCVCTLGLAVFILVTPYCASLVTMLAARFATGVFCGGLDTGGVSYLFYDLTRSLYSKLSGVVELSCMSL